MPFSHNIRCYTKKLFYKLFMTLYFFSSRIQCLIPVVLAAAGTYNGCFDSLIACPKIEE